MKASVGLAAIGGDHVNLWAGTWILQLATLVIVGFVVTVWLIHPRGHGRRMGLTAVAVGALTLAGCGSNSSRESTAAGGITVPTTQPATLVTDSSGAVVVDIDAGNYFFKSPLTTFKVGVPYHFVVHNPSTETHEFMVVEPIAAGAMTMEMMDGMALAHIEENDLKVQQTTTIDVTFTKPYPAGMLEFSCHIRDHYEKGMRLPIVVTP
jgi:uncharacterized cupredoxin-like copper-binding protein